MDPDEWLVIVKGLGLCGRDRRTRASRPVDLLG
jgi:hypothetical protein